MSEPSPKESATRIITVKESRLTLPDLLDDLLWPKLFRASPLALQPGHIGIALFTLAIVGLIGFANTWWSDSPNFFITLAATLGTPSQDLTAGRAGPLADIISRASNLLHTHPLALIFQGVPILAILSIGICTISRMTATEFSAGVTMSWTEGLTFTLKRWPSTLGAAFGAPILIGLIALLLAIFGAAFFYIPGLDIVGSIVFLLIVPLALLAAILTLGLLLGHPMLVPAFACEGSDAIDALQRVYAYVLARPGRLIVYTLILGLILLATSLVAYALAGATDALARSATSAWLAPNPSHILASDAAPEGPTRKFASAIINTWLSCVWLIAAACVLATYASGSTILYLLMRQASDGQDWGELWFPEHANAGRDELSTATSGDTSLRSMSSAARSEDPA
ncbi:MAG: hypothetical protein KF912_13855 [Phycisphaeraceae bacterium]|nr:hypothetical protein [Phycisphaeraceae bacterium]